MERIIWTDYAKSIGIFLVVLAHTPLNESLQNWIYVFHMPLFFFISGYLFSFDRHGSLKSFARLRFRQLIVPYAWFNAISFAAWFLVLRHYGSDAESGMSWWLPALNALLGNGGMMIHNVPLWFFVCLYIVEIVYYVFFRGQSHFWYAVTCFCLAGWANYALSPVYLPFSIGTALVAVCFYAAGNYVRSHGMRRSVLAAILSVCVTVVVAYLNGRINMHVNYYGSFPLFMAGGFAGIYMVFYICGLFRRTAAAEYVSCNTITVCGIHLLAFSAIKFVMVYLAGVSPDILSDSVLPDVVFAAAAMALSLAAARVIKRYFPFVIGLRRINYDSQR